MDKGLGRFLQLHVVGHIVVLGAALALTLAGCGATSQQAPVVTSVHVLRTSAFPSNHIPPLDQTVTDSTKSQRLYDAVQALPPFPEGTIIHCPADFGEAYHLTFYRGRTQVSWAIVKPDGCRGVTLPRGGPRSSIGQDHFWRVFADALGVPESTLFQGPKPDGLSAPTAAPGQP